MKTLLKPGDMIRIRKDIKEDENYYMILSDRNNWKNSNTWTKSMAPANTLITVTSINQYGQYLIDYVAQGNEDLGWNYTDQMFDPEMLEVILQDRYNL